MPRMSVNAAGPRASSARVEACLAAIDTWQSRVNAMVTVTEDAARVEAAAADRAESEGRWLGLLHGMPMVIKDNLDTAGVRTTAGSLFFKDHIPNRDATVVAKLKRAGAVIVGKCTMHEVAFGVRSYNPVTGQARNPYDRPGYPAGRAVALGSRWRPAWWRQHLARTPAARYDCPPRSAASRALGQHRAGSPVRGACL